MYVYVDFFNFKKVCVEECTVYVAGLLLLLLVVLMAMAIQRQLGEGGHVPLHWLKGLG